MAASGAGFGLNYLVEAGYGCLHARLQLHWWLTEAVGPVNVGSIGSIRQQREQAKISLRQLASAAGVSNPTSQIERDCAVPAPRFQQTPRG
jgi:hypothetical protein